MARPDITGQGGASSNTTGFGGAKKQEDNVLNIFSDLGFGFTKQSTRGGAEQFTSGSSREILNNLMASQGIPAPFKSGVASFQLAADLAPPPSTAPIATPETEPASVDVIKKAEAAKASTPADTAEITQIQQLFADPIFLGASVGRKRMTRN